MDSRDFGFLFHDTLSAKDRPSQLIRMPQVYDLSLLFPKDETENLQISHLREKTTLFLCFL